jgi:porphobilinogen synthase
MVMVKPAGPYLDVIRRLREATTCLSPPTRSAASTRCSRPPASAAGSTSASVVLESLLGIRRAGADVILTYYARQAAMWLAEAGIE